MKNAGVVDMIWGLGFVVQAAVYLSKDADKGLNYPKIIFASLVMAHGLRLSLYIMFRGCGKPEDKRYRTIFREKYGDNMWWVSFFLIFAFQALINLIVGMVLYAFESVQKQEDINLGAFFFGVAVMFMGTLYETIADLQLYYFKSNTKNQGKVLNAGLWYYSRHPNYFGESVFWVGTYICNLSAVIWFTFFFSTMHSFKAKINIFNIFCLSILGNFSIIDKGCIINLNSPVDSELLDYTVLQINLTAEFYKNLQIRPKISPLL
jgi:steroid 5-alpha reductase family enzyme